MCKAHDYPERGVITPIFQVGRLRRGCPEARGGPAAQAGGLQGSRLPGACPPPHPREPGLEPASDGAASAGSDFAAPPLCAPGRKDAQGGPGSPEPGRNDLWLSFKPRRQCPLRPCGPPPPPTLQLPRLPSSSGHDFPAFSALGRDRRPGGAEFAAICITCPIGSCGRGGRAPPAHLPGWSAGPGRRGRATWPPPGARRPQGRGVDRLHSTQPLRKARPPGNVHLRDLRKAEREDHI
ncbi:basic proline-rich protein-like [Vulpes lagopus]|uniref:basic proline-rich protein-like n=1 Tax=Vulpes lagopus TaxID=494514 RepID=UPI001BC9862F|nr:basic proline-rich protein-like [Vulpes lagopus]